MWGLKAPVDASTPECGSTPGPSLFQIQAVRPVSHLTFPPSLYSLITASSPLPLQSPKPTISAADTALPFTRQEKDAGLGCPHGETQKRLQTQQLFFYPPPSLQESSVNTHTTYRNQERFPPLLPPPCLPTIMAPPGKQGPGYLSGTAVWTKTSVRRFLVT